MEEKMTKQEVLSTAMDALQILSNRECKDLPPTLRKNCEERKKRFKKAWGIIEKMHSESKE